MEEEAAEKTYVAETITALPVEANGVAWVDIHNARSVLGTNTTVVRWVVDAVDGLKVEHLADGARVAVAVTGTVRGRCLVEGLIANLDRSKITMRRNVGREEDGEKCKSGRAHCSRSVVVDYKRGREGRRIRGVLSEWNVLGLVWVPEDKTHSANQRERVVK